MVKIKSIYKGDRPRERLLKFGASRLKDSELLALILGSGTKEKNVIELSESILKEISVKYLTEVSVEKLLKFKGVGYANAIKIIAVLEFAKRIKDKKKIIIYSPKDIWIELNNIKNNKKEYFLYFVWTQETAS